MSISLIRAADFWITVGDRRKLLNQSYPILRAGTAVNAADIWMAHICPPRFAAPRWSVLGTNSEPYLCSR